jgi:hypothetical protein
MEQKENQLVNTEVLMCIKVKNYYKLPLEYDEFGSFAMSDTGNVSLMFEFDLEEDICKQIVNIINGGPNSLNKKFYLENNTDFYILDENQNKIDMFIVRGWSNLIIEISHEQARKLQKKFTDYILKMLNS